jgi:hypothetical protein
LSLEITGDALRMADEGGIAITFSPWYRIEAVVTVILLTVYTAYCVRQQYRRGERYDAVALAIAVGILNLELEARVEERTAELTAPDLQGLLAACRSSVSRGHSGLLLELIDQIRADHAQVAEALTGLVHALRFRTIVTLTEQAEGQL